MGWGMGVVGGMGMGGGGGGGEGFPGCGEEGGECVAGSASVGGGEEGLVGGFFREWDLERGAGGEWWIAILQKEKEKKRKGGKEKNVRFPVLIQHDPPPRFPTPQ